MSGISDSPELQGLKLNEAIGKTIVCEDGIPRQVVEICMSVPFAWRAVINEQDPDSKAGHFVNLLSLSSQLLNKGVPPKEAQEAFARMVGKMSIKNAGGDIVPPTRKLD